MHIIVKLNLLMKNYYELLISLKMKVLLILQGTLALKLTESL